MKKYLCEPIQILRSWQFSIQLISENFSVQGFEFEEFRLWLFSEKLSSARKKYKFFSWLHGPNKTTQVTEPNNQTV